MQGSYPSQISMDLASVRRKIKRGWTEGNAPRQFTSEEMEAFHNKEQILVGQQSEAKEARRAARINEHITKEA